MYKILAITPASIAGELIIEGFGKGFKKLGYDVLIQDIRKIDKQTIENFKPDFAIGYDYAHFYEEKAEKLLSNIPVIHYFADGPNSKFADLGNDIYFKKLSNSDNLVFCWEKTYIKDFKNKAYYLPLGINIEDYKTKTIELNNKINFVGRPLGQKRQEMLAEVIKNFGDTFELYCFEKHFLQSIEDFKNNNLLDFENLEKYKKSYKGFLTTTNQLAQVYANSNISLNITIQGENNINYRVFEVLASKGLLLSDKMNDTVEHFKNNDDIVIYENKEDLIKQIQNIQNNKYSREQIIKNGYKKVMHTHTFEKRAKEIISKIN